MKKRIILGLVSLTAVLCMTAMASAGVVTWNVLTHSSKIGIGPGNDGLMGTADDAADADNTAGTFAVDPNEWGTHDGSCPASDPGPDDVAYSTAGTISWCQGSPSAGQVEWYSVALNFKAIPAYYNIPYTYGLTQPRGTDDIGSPCGTGTVNSTVDLTISQVGFPAFNYPDASVSAHVYAVGTPSPAAVSCPKVDGGTATWTTANLLAIEALLPGAATYYMVSCGATPVTGQPPPCFDTGYVTGQAWVFWTSGDVTDCDGCSAPPGGCAGAPAE